jgi:hypothetical protein
MIDAAPTGSAVPADAVAKMEQAKADIASGKLDIFAGPITDNQGASKVADGDTIPLDERSACCDWYVQGVEGTVPSS